MSIPIVLPDLSTGAAEVRVSSWFVEPGEPLDEGDRVVEVLAPGITFDVVSPTSGLLERVEQPVDSVVCAGDVLGWIAETNTTKKPEN